MDDPNTIHLMNQEYHDAVHRATRTPPIWEQDANPDVYAQLAIAAAIRWAATAIVRALECQNDAAITGGACACGASLPSSPSQSSTQSGTCQGSGSCCD